MKSLTIKIICIFLLASQLARSQSMKVSSGMLKRCEQVKSSYIAGRDVYVWLPEGYTSQNKYAVLYMHDGQMLFDGASSWNGQEWGVDETLADLIRNDSIRPCIVVGIVNGGGLRHAEYMMQQPFETFSGHIQDSLIQHAKRHDGSIIFNAKVRSDYYLSFIVKELKPFIDSSFSTLPDKDNTFIAGSSMGGIISLYAICEYPEVFGGAACLSTHWPILYTNSNNPFPGAIMAYLEKKLPDPASHKIYLDRGDKTLDTLYAYYQFQADAIFRKKGYHSNNFKSLVFEGEDHSEEAWRKRLHIPMSFLLRK